jgi:uncharacterized protein YjcR
MAEVTIAQKKDWAKLIYTREGLNQKQTADKVGISTKTMCKWVEEGKWDLLKASLTISKENELRRIYAQINDLNTAIENRETGQRHANSKEADTLTKLAAAAKALESEASVTEIFDTFVAFNEFLRPFDLAFTQKLTEYQDAFIKSRLK